MNKTIKRVPVYFQHIGAKRALTETMFNTLESAGKIVTIRGKGKYLRLYVN